LAQVVGDHAVLNSEYAARAISGLLVEGVVIVEGIEKGQLSTGVLSNRSFSVDGMKESKPGERWHNA
jgi:hypothetical protein